MDSLCNAIESELGKAFGSEAIANWEIKQDGADTCRVRTPKLLITFNFDRRDELITSSIIFLEAKESDREHLYTHILAKLFPNISLNDVKSSESLSNKVAMEVDNLYQLLHVIGEESVSARDLLYFYLGYNCAYTDYT